MHINEIFSSIQGEGIYVGYRQIFIRFAGCNIDCDYCDTNHQNYEFTEPTEIVKLVNALNKVYHHSLSLTGGEPLLQINDLLSLLPEISLPKYLETNATLPAYLEEIKGLIDIFSLDFKVGYEKEFQACLEIVKDEDTFVKFILNPQPKMVELRQAIDIMSATNKDVPFIIQPVTPTKKIKHRPTGDEVITAYALAKKKLNDVRVIPQTHTILGLK